MRLVYLPTAASSKSHVLQKYNTDDATARLVGYEIEFTPIRREEAPRDLLDHCVDCNFKFGITGRHHCRYYYFLHLHLSTSTSKRTHLLDRNCGHSVCGNCSSMVKGVPGVQAEEGVRLCERCRLSLTPRKTLKEIVVLRQQRGVHMYQKIWCEC